MAHGLLYCTRDMVRGQQELLLSTILFSSNIIPAVAHATCFVHEDPGMCQLLLKYYT